MLERGTFSKEALRGKGWGVNEERDEVPKGQR